ncbi:MAG: dihydroorotase [Candidatus Eisenbacteria sp.]|nr:dihydroorotase [Candidatus Eisenbacteria bacterium]
MSLVLRNGRVIDPASGRDEIADVWIADGCIRGVGQGIAPEGATIVDLTGKVVVPGLIDMHVHLREPGREDEETIESGTRAAVRGGFTTVVCMPNTEPAIDTEASVEYVLERARTRGYGRVFPVGAITRGRGGEMLADLGAMVEAGAVAVSDDGSSVENGHLMRRALEYCRMLGVPVAAHCEDALLSQGGVVNEGTVSALLGLNGSPAQAETARVAREILLAELTGGHLHIQHVSTAQSVELIARARDRGVRVTAEATPHHLVLTEDAVRTFDTNAKVNPPLREERDREAVREGLRMGAIDAIATDHAPHAREEKEVEFDEAAFGLLGLETAVGLVLTELVAPGVLTLTEAVRLLSLGPAQVLGLDLGTLGPGKPADVTVLDLDEMWTVEPDGFESRSKNTPFAGWQLTGRPIGALVDGRFVMWKGEVRRFGEEVPCASSDAAC